MKEELLTRQATKKKKKLFRAAQRLSVTGDINDLATPTHRRTLYCFNNLFGAAWLAGWRRVSQGELEGQVEPLPVSAHQWETLKI